MRSSDGRERKKTEEKTLVAFFRDQQDEWTAQAVITIGISVHNDTFGYVNLPSSAKNDRFDGLQMADEKTQRWSEQTVSRKTRKRAFEIPKSHAKTKRKCRKRLKLWFRLVSFLGTAAAPRMEDRDAHNYHPQNASLFSVPKKKKNYRFQLLSNETMRKPDKKVQKQKEEERKQKGTSCCAQRVIFSTHSDRQLERDEAYARGEGKYRITFLLLASVALIFIPLK